MSGAKISPAGVGEDPCGNEVVSLEDRNQKLTTMADVVDAEMGVEMPNSGNMLRKRENSYIKPSEMMRADSNHDKGGSRWDQLRHTVREDILGSISSANGHGHFDQMWYKVDPYKAEQMVRAPKNYNPANKYFGCLYFFGVILFGVYAFYSFLTRPVIESYSIAPSNRVQPIPIRVEMHCTANWRCSACSDVWGTDWSCENGTIAWTTVSQQYLSTKPGYCQEDAVQEVIRSNLGPASPSGFDLTACYSTEFTDGVLIHVPFAEAYASSGTRLVVTVTSPGAELFYEQELEPAQRKSVFLGQTIYTDVDGSKKTEVYVSDLFYDGKNSDSAAELRIRMTQFSTTSDRTRPGTIFDVFASIGGFVTFLLPVTGILRDICMFTFHKFLLCDNDGSGGSLWDVFSGCLESVGISFGGGGGGAESFG